MITTWNTLWNRQPSKQSVRKTMTMRTPCIVPHKTLAKSWLAGHNHRWRVITLVVQHCLVWGISLDLYFSLQYLISSGRSSLCRMISRARQWILRLKLSAKSKKRPDKSFKLFVLVRARSETLIAGSCWTLRTPRILYLKVKPKWKSKRLTSTLINSLPRIKARRKLQGLSLEFI